METESTHRMPYGWLSWGTPLCHPLVRRCLAHLLALDDLPEMYDKDVHSSWGAWWELGPVLS